MNRSPRATPPAPTPLPSVSPVPRRVVSTLLVAPVFVVAPEVERELARGSLSVGRHPDSDIPLLDPLVSRAHARITILDDGGVAVEDLHSTNGVYVNGVRVARGIQRLHDGDRLLIGTCELSIFATRAAAADTEIPASEPSERPLRSERESEGPPATDRADALTMLGRFAERLHKSGNTVEAVRVLSGHLNKVLLGASAGLAAPYALLDEATRYGLALFRWTENPAWLDYVIELHLTAQELASEKSITALELALAEAAPARLDGALLDYYLDSLENQRGAYGLDEEARRARLRKLGR